MRHEMRIHEIRHKRGESEVLNSHVAVVPIRRYEENPHPSLTVAYVSCIDEPPPIVNPHMCFQSGRENQIIASTLDFPTSVVMTV
jgi:hypothetical protein